MSYKHTSRCEFVSELSTVMFSCFVLFYSKQKQSSNILHLYQLYQSYSYTQESDSQLTTKCDILVWLLSSDRLFTRFFM